MHRHELYEYDTTPSRAVVERYRATIQDDASDVSLALVHYRGGREEYNLGAEYARSSDPLDRVTGADILAQLGWAEQSFHDESLAVLLQLLDDVEESVVAAAAVALGHRGDPNAIPPLLDLAGHPNADVRFGVVLGLTGHPSAHAIGALLRLTTDADDEVRDWATFALGSQTCEDTPDIRDALRANLADPDHEIRGEALVGLAARNDPQISAILTHEWESSDSVSLLSIRAAELAADARLLDQLQCFKRELPLDDEAAFRAALDAAIDACGG